MDQQTWSHFRSSWLLITFELDVISYQPREGALRDNYNNYYRTRVVIERASFAHSLVLRLVCTMTMWLWISDGDDKNDWDHAIYVDDLYRIAWWWFWSWSCLSFGYSKSRIFSPKIDLEDVFRRRVRARALSSRHHIYQSDGPRSLDYVHIYCCFC